MKELYINLLLCLVACILFSCNPADEDEYIISKPNIVFVLVDDLRWDEFGAAGHNYIQTPNIDRMVREGMWFKNAFATTPLCSPSRASYLTGKYAHNHGITDNTDRSELSHRLQSFPIVLDSLGYATAFIGKWHMGNDNTPRPGFDFWAGLKGQGEAIDPMFNENGTELTKNGYVTDILTDYSLQFINAHASVEPFMLYVSHKGLHPNMHQDATGSISKIGEGGFIPAERHKGLYDDQVFDRRPNAFITPEDKPALMRKIEGFPEYGVETATPEQDIRERAEMLLAIDEGLGRILAELEELGILDQTLVIFASDHGYWYGEHGLNEERRLGYEEGLRIPVLMRYPPMIRMGSTCSEMVLNIDMAPTLIELAGGEPAAQMDGESIVPYMEGNAPDTWRNSFLIEYYSDTVWPRVVTMGYKGLRTERYKYIQYTELEGMDEFYDLEKDPYELSNSISDPEYKDVIFELKTLLQQNLNK